MRLRMPLLAGVIAAGGAVAVPAAASAAPHHNRGLTIHAVPNPISTGDAVLIYGRLAGSGHGGQPIRLYHRIAGQPAFTLIGTTTTNALGEYEFTRAEGIVETNRSWYVRGPLTTHSRTVHERVAALVSLGASSSSGTTGHPLVFSGHVTPDHHGGVVLLQEQKGSSDDWATLRRALIGPGSDYQISYAWRTPGPRDVRVLFRRDAPNIGSTSDPAAVVIEQAQRPDFTINSSNPITQNGQPAMISGVLSQPGTTTPQPNTSVSLYANEPGRRAGHLVQTTTTGAGGGYSFTVAPTTNEVYVVRTTFAPARHSARLFQGVQDVVTMTASSTTSMVNGHITFTGSVAPGEAEHVIYLQKLGRPNDWQTVEVRRLTDASTFRFGWTFATAGVKQFRARITGGPVNVGAASTPVTIDATQPPLTG